VLWSYNKDQNCKIIDWHDSAITQCFLFKYDFKWITLYIMPFHVSLPFLTFLRFLNETTGLSRKRIRLPKCMESLFEFVIQIGITVVIIIITFNL
jgi:hypothetical protein